MSDGPYYTYDPEQRLFESSKVRRAKLNPIMKLHYADLKDCCWDTLEGCVKSMRKMLARKMHLLIDVLTETKREQVMLELVSTCDGCEDVLYEADMQEWESINGRVTLYLCEHCHTYRQENPH